MVWRVGNCAAGVLERLLAFGFLLISLLEVSVEESHLNELHWLLISLGLD